MKPVDRSREGEKGRCENRGPDLINQTMPEAVVLSTWIIPTKDREHGRICHRECVSIAANESPLVEESGPNSRR